MDISSVSGANPVSSTSSTTDSSAAALGAQKKKIEQQIKALQSDTKTDPKTKAATLGSLQTQLQQVTSRIQHRSTGKVQGASGGGRKAKAAAPAQQPVAPKQGKGVTPDGKADVYI